MLERDYQAGLIKRIRAEFPGAVVLKNDTSYIQGIPDLTVLYGTHWAELEVKPHPRARRQPNQDYYVDTLNRMSYAALIYPENEHDILSEIQYAFQLPGHTRIS